MSASLLEPKFDISHNNAQGRIPNYGASLSVKIPVEQRPSLVQNLGSECSFVLRQKVAVHDHRRRVLHGILARLPF